MTSTGGRADSRTGAIAVIVLLVTATAATSLTAQDSQFGIRGLGTPGKWESVRARSAGGAFAPFDPFSSLTDAALIDARRLAGSITGGASWRTVQANGSEAPVRGTRFPVLVVAGPLNRRLVLGAGFSTYLDRTFGISTNDTINIRGDTVPITDVVTSEGGVSDLRLALAGRVNRWLALGGGLHLLTGQTLVVASRTFGDTSYRNTTSRAQVAYRGQGASVSALLDLTPNLRVSGWFRADSKLDADILGKLVASNDLPNSYGTALQWRLGGQLAVAGTAAWRDWTASSPIGHNTFNWTFGAEIGSFGSGLRLGARGGQMPFGAGSAPTEVGLSGGFGKQFSQGRGRIDLGLEHLQRKGTGLNERVWTFLMGLTVRP